MNLILKLGLSLLFSGLFGCSPGASANPAAPTPPAKAFDHSHAAFTVVLEKGLKAGKFDYAALAKSPSALDAYLDSLAGVSEAEFNLWSEGRRKAFLINLYNASTLKLVADHYPVKSIKDIGGLFSSPWKQPSVRLFGKKQTLDHVEHGLLRPVFKDPRIHFAVNCASIGCPELRAEAYQETKLEAQLEEQGKRFLQDTTKNRVDAASGKLLLSPIFSWFKEDFTTKSGTVEKFVAPYFGTAERALIEKGGLSISHTDYDWKLNRQ